MGRIARAAAALLAAGAARWFAGAEGPEFPLNDGLAPTGRDREAGLTVWMTGLSGSGKTTIAVDVVRTLTRANTWVYRLDGDNVRKGLNSDLKFSEKDRTENNRRIAEVAKLFNDAGAIVICALISPYEQDRAWARSIHESAGLPFLEVFVDAPLSVTEERDPKGLYAKARQGVIPQFTGVSAPYEVPTNPDVHIRTDRQTVEESSDTLLQAIRLRVGTNSSKFCSTVDGSGSFIAACA